MTDVSNIDFHNGHQVRDAAYLGNDKPVARPKRHSRLVRDQILDHLLSGKTITEKEAKEQYNCGNLTASVHQLRVRGNDIITVRCRDDNGYAYASYRLAKSPVVEREISDPLLSTADPPAAESVQQSMVLPEPLHHEDADPTPASEAPEPAADQWPLKNVGTVTVRLGETGPEIQVCPLGEGDSHIFYQLSPAQVRYLYANMKMFMDEDR